MACAPTLSAQKNDYVFGGTQRRPVWKAISENLSKSRKIAVKEDLFPTLLYKELALVIQEMSQLCTPHSHFLFVMTRFKDH